MESRKLQPAPSGMEVEECEAYNDRVAALRVHEYPMIKSTYLDHAGTAVPSRSLMDAFTAEILSSMISNPHSASTLSQATAQTVDDIRVRALSFFGADPDHFDIIFVANATAAIKLVAEAFRDNARGFWYGYHKDAHTSIVGVRELAKHGSHCFQSDAAVESWLDADTPLSIPQCPILFAYPGQSNMNGRRLSLDWPRRLAQSSRKEAYILLDAAALVATAPLDLHDSDRAPDFVALSFYKIFGFPDLGALIVHNRAAHVFDARRYFGGGTVDFVSCLQEKWHISKSTTLHSRIEDGTLPLRSIVALRCAIDTYERLYESQVQVSKHTTFLMKILYDRLQTLKHANGQPVLEIYADSNIAYNNASTQGPILAFNLRDSRGNYYSCYEFSKFAAIKNIQVRTGTLCNPGGVAEALGTSTQDLRELSDAGEHCGSAGDVKDGRPVAMVRVSLGAPSTLQDIQNFVSFIEEFFVDRVSNNFTRPTQGVSLANYLVESVTIYPIKSCGGWQLPQAIDWPIWKEGLAWDRQWCLLHQSTKVYINQKRCPKMALMRPTLDLSANLLHVRFVGTPDKSVPNMISIPLGISHQGNWSRHEMEDTLHTSNGSSQSQIYRDARITKFFTTHLAIPCYLARVKSSTGLQTGGAAQESPKLPLGQFFPSPTLRVPGAFPTPPPSPPPDPRTFSNESPILTISRLSVDHVNRFRHQELPEVAHEPTASTAIDPTSFRANILLAPRDLRNREGLHAQPFEEESWSRMQIYRPSLRDALQARDEGEFIAELEVVGRCKRCQMICINQQSGMRRPDPFTTLAKIRSNDGGVCFGVHCLLPTARQAALSQPCIRVGDWVEGVPAR